MTIKPLLQKFWSAWVRPLLLPVLAVTAFKSAFADINYVPTGSMKPTILEGDVVFVNKLAYDLKVPFTTVHLAQWGNPAEGDIVVCFAPDDRTRLVKRVIGVPGDQVELRENVLFLNGSPLTYAGLDHAAKGVRDMEPLEQQAARFALESLATRNHAVMSLPTYPARRNFGPVVVPAGQYLMMGDNRDNSRDSRSFGFVPRRDIVGEAKGIFVSGDLHHYLEPRFNRFFSGLN